MRVSVLAVLCLAYGLAFAADGTGKAGTVYATVNVSAAGEASFLQPPSGGLPERVLKQLESVFLSRAQKAHAESSDDASYRLAIDWKAVLDGDREQLQFDYRTSDLKPIVMVEPVYPIRMLLPEDDVEVVLRFTVLPDGSVVDVVRTGGNPDMDFFVNARDAVRRWKFVPKYTDGLAVAREAELPVLFLAIGSADRDDMVNVGFKLDADGEPHQLEFQRAIPQCLDAEALHEEIKEVIRRSEAANAVRSGSVAHREGQVRMQMPPCP